MPIIRVHCAISKKRTGKNYEELHNWIDHSGKKEGVDHRTENHAFNTTDRDHILKEWGQEGVVEWLFHIAVDNLYTAFKESRKLDKNSDNLFFIGFNDWKRFVNYKAEKVTEEELKAFFRNKL